jgi:hypothetical protein
MHISVITKKRGMLENRIEVETIEIMEKDIGLVVRTVSVFYLVSS